MLLPFLNVTNGDSSAGTLRVGLPCEPEEMLVQHDVLSRGPLRRFQSLEEWRRVRGEFWNSIDCGQSFFEPSRDLMSNAQELRDREGIVLWICSGLSDRLLLPSTVRPRPFAFKCPRTICSSGAAGH